MSIYQDHIEQLAGVLNVKIVQAPGMPGMMYVEESPSRIEIATIDNKVYKWYPSEPQTKYIAALHELGHCFLNHTQGRPPHQHATYYFQNGVLKSEAQAWDFALKHCTDTLKEVTRQFMLWCFSSYRTHALDLIKHGANTNVRLPNGNRHYVSFEYDDPYDPYVVSILEQLSVKQSVN